MLEVVCIPLLDFAIFAPGEEHVCLGDELHTHDAGTDSFHSQPLMDHGFTLLASH